MVDAHTIAKDLSQKNMNGEDSVGVGHEAYANLIQRAYCCTRK